MDMTEAEFADNTPQIQLHNVELAVIDEKSSDTIFNVIIMEKDKEINNG